MTEESNELRCCIIKLDHLNDENRVLSFYFGAF